MALDEIERQFYETAQREGMDDAEIASRIRTRRERTSPYQPTNYAGEAAKLPSRQPEYEALMARGLSPEQAIDSVHHTDQVVAGRSPESRRRDEDVYANDPLATMVLSGMLGAGAGSLVGGVARPILAGAANSATQTAVTGGDLEDVGKSALIGAAIPAAGRIVKGVGNRIRGSEGGQARALWEKHGGNIGPLDSGSGVEEIAGLEPSRANVGKASAIGAENIRKGLGDSFETKTGAPYRAAREAVDYGPAGKELVDVSSLRGTIADELYAERTPHSVRPFLQKELDHLDKLRDADGRVMVTQSRLNEMRQRLSDQADYGINTGGGAGNLKDRSFKTVANAAKVLVDEGPYAEANSTYSAGMSEQATDRAALGLRKRPSASEAGRATEDAKVAQILRNRNNDAEAPGAMARRADVPGFVSRHPELERQVDLPDLVRAKGKLEFGLDGGKTHNLIQASEHPTALKKYLDLLGHNADAVNGRLLYAPAGAAQAVGGDAQLTSMNQLMAALAAQRERERQRAEALGR